MIVADASPLIALAKIERLELLSELYEGALIGPIIKRETIDAGRSIAASGVEQIEAAVSRGDVRLIRTTGDERHLTQRLLKRSRLDRGEAEAIAIAHFRNIALLVDDREARSVAATMDVDFLGTAAVLLEAYLRGRFGMSDLEDAVRGLSKVIWLSPAVVAEILKRAREAQG